MDSAFGLQLDMYPIRCCLRRELDAVAGQHLKNWNHLRRTPSQQEERREEQERGYVEDEYTGYGKAESHFGRFGRVEDMLCDRT